VAVAARDDDGNVRMAKQGVIRSTNADRIGNMRLAAKMALDVINAGVAEQYDDSLQYLMRVLQRERF